MRKKHTWPWAVLIMAVILLMSSTPGDQAGPTFRSFFQPLQDAMRQARIFSYLKSMTLWLKIGHVVMYAVLGAVLYSAFLRAGRKGFWLPTLIVLGFAGLDELVQSYVPGRSALLSDVLLDTTAALLAMVMIKLIADSMTGDGRRRTEIDG